MRHLTNQERSRLGSRTKSTVHIELRGPQVQAIAEAPGRDHDPLVVVSIRRTTHSREDDGVVNRIENLEPNPGCIDPGIARYPRSHADLSRTVPHRQVQGPSSLDLSRRVRVGQTGRRCERHREHSCDDHRNGW